MNEQESRHFFDRAAETWNQNPNRAERLRRLPEIFSGYFKELRGTVMDVGCGAGVLLPLLSNRDEIERIIAIDSAFGMVSKARELNNTAENTYFLNASACDLCCRAASVDHIIAFALYPHLERPKDAIREFFRALRPGGSVHILHLMSHDKLNAMHKQHHPKLSDHILPPIAELSRLMVSFDFEIVLSIEKDDLYLLRARKP